MLKIYSSPDEFIKIQKATAADTQQLRQHVSDIIARVRRDGDRALTQLTEKFDGVKLPSLRVPQPLLDDSLQKLDAEIRRIFERAIENVRRFHENQLPKSWLETLPDGSRRGLQFTPMQNVGVYVPGGRAAYPSTVIMTVMPAQIAGVERIALVSPPTREGGANQLVLAVARLLGINEIYTVGGAQAIAALAYGTKSIPPVDKIVGPGNAFVNEAKRQVFGDVGIDSLAGPSEVVVLADDSANPQYIARDLLAQAEHDPDARALLITPSKKLTSAVAKIIEQLLPGLPRKEILQKSLTNAGAVILVNDIAEAARVVNQIAPEHVQIMTENLDQVWPQMRNAGAIFVGEFSPVAIGDYFAGSNHVLPTAASARFASPLSVWDFMKFSSLVQYSKERFRSDAKHIARFAELEGLYNHQFSIECRS